MDTSSPTARATGDVRACGEHGRPFQLKGAGGQGPGQLPSSTGRTQAKLSWRKTALFRLRLVARTTRAAWEADGVR
jgi:hypothetical protein